MSWSDQPKVGYDFWNGLASLRAGGVPEVPSMVAFLCLLLAGLAGYIISLRGVRERLRIALRAVQVENESLRVVVERYRPVMDAEAYAARIRTDADRQSAAMLQSGLEQTRKADQRVGEAQQQAEAIVANASRRAEEIAGDALRAKAKAAEMAATLQAIRNAIDGYGDAYLIPTHSLLDEIAEGAGFAEAGQRLKSAREHVRSMVKTRKAAACEDVNVNRRLLAIHFVLDAFNGKVESILSDVWHDNFGTLQQKIRDAAILVNKNGEAVERARVLPQYVEARVAELMWAVAAHELKQREREEQRLLREQIREEERAQKEFERSMKEAAKEEESLRAAMEKVQREVERATDAQRAKYEQQLAQLNAKLIAAEEKNRRALSMAQQTKAGTVYVISNVGSFGESVFKIGMTRRLEPQDRIDELGDASVPFPFDVHALIRAEDAPKLEKELHRRLAPSQVNKVNPRKEFFRANVQEIRAAVEAMGHSTVEWTMAAACQEYRESLVSVINPRRLNGLLASSPQISEPGLAE